MGRNSTTGVSYEVLDAQISLLRELRDGTAADINAKYNEVKGAFVNSDSKAAEGFCNAADTLYSINTILQSMISQSITTLQYAEALFYNTDAVMSQTMREEG